jgi:hypothetical protein
MDVTDLCYVTYDRNIICTKLVVFIDKCWQERPETSILSAAAKGAPVNCRYGKKSKADDSRLARLAVPIRNGCKLSHSA